MILTQHLIPQLYRARPSRYKWFIREVRRRRLTCQCADDFLCAFGFVATVPFSFLISGSAGWLLGLCVNLYVCMCAWQCCTGVRWKEECIANQNNQSLFSLSFSCCACYFAGCRELTLDVPQNKDYPPRGRPLQFTASFPPPPSPLLPC